MLPGFIRNSVDYLFQSDLYHKIPDDDLLTRQRYRLYGIFTFASIIICMLVAAQAYFILQQANFILWSLLVISFVFAANYYFLLRHKNMPVAFTIAILGGFFIIHVVTYYSGGIRNSGVFYLGAIILIAFMLLGSKGGKIIALVCVLHLLFFYYITENTRWVTNILVGGSENLLDQDFLITGLLAIFVISAQVNYLESGKNIVIQRITESRNELREKNILLAKNINELEKTNRELDKFASIVSHDLKAPLRAIGNITGWIEDDLGPAMQGDVKQNFDVIRQRVARMEGLINGLLEYSKADRKKGDVVNVDVNTLVKDTLDFIGKPENLKLEILTTLPVIMADKLRLEQVFANLLDNAIKYNDKEKIEIKISALEKPDEWIFTVADNGPGIEPQYHEKVFVIFQTLNRRDKVESTGVGLSIVKKIIEEQGGKIWIESDKGQGASFHFSYPKSIELHSRLVAVA
ncbi:MAG: GHKL domain-containing protein [Bacteroidia bacterium]|nr:GHKL domain-containing protein [Bacteroidia bacterium]